MSHSVPIRSLITLVNLQKIIVTFIHLHCRTLRSLFSTNALKFFTVITHIELWNMVKIDNHYQVRSTSIFFLGARLLLDQSAKRLHDEYYLEILHLPLIFLIQLTSCSNHFEYYRLSPASCADKG